MRANAKIIAIEGIDGSGKSIQSKLLALRLRADNLQVAEFSFPNYDSPTGTKIAEYLNGKLGNVETFNSYEAARLFTLDRVAVKDDIKAAIKNSDVVIMNRYVISNLAHQGYRITDETQRHAFYNMILNDEHGIHGLPQADCNIILYVPTKIAQTLIDKKDDRSHLEGKKRDEHEDSISHLNGAADAYTELANWLPKTRVITINCAPHEELLKVREITELIYNKVKTLLN